MPQADRFEGGRWRCRTLLVDVLLWASLAGLVYSSWTGHRAYPIGLLFAGLALWGGAVAVGRRLPLVPLFTVVLLCVLDGNYCFGLPLVSYLLGRRTENTWPAVASYCAFAVLGTPLVLSWSGFVAWATMAGALVYAGLFPWLVGRYRRQQRALIAAGWEQAERLEREQQMLTREVRLRERARIAEEMHDSLGHELSLLALRAGALEVSTDLDERTRAVAAQLRAGAATATGQLRDIIDVLRDDPDSERGAERGAERTSESGAENGSNSGAESGSGGEKTEPAPGAGDLADLVRRARAAGMPVELHDRRRPAEPLPAQVGRTVYRVVRESLTNANKHAPGAAVRVRLEADDSGAVVVSVVNTRPPAAPRPATVPVGGGRGLVGLRERVRLTGGTLRTGARDGGFEVVARLPGEVLARLPGPAGWQSAAAPADPPSSGAYPTTGSAADRRRRVHREARRGLVGATMVLATFAATLGGAALGYYLYATSNSVLSPERYAALRVGQDWASALPLLPRREILEPPDPDPLPAPAGADCRYYRSHGNVLQPRLDVYRLCAARGKLVSKDLLPAS